MAIIDFLKKQFIDIIEWTDDSRDTLSWRFPDEDKEIKNGAQLIVRESQLAQFVYLGQFGDAFGPGKHTLTTDNIPILTNLKSWKYALESPFKADVYYVVTRAFTGNKWGTANPVMMRDADFGIVRLRAYGTFDHPIHYGTFCAALLAQFWYATTSTMERRKRAVLLAGATFLGLSSAPIL